MLMANAPGLENEIVGEALIALKHEELKEMNILSVGHRLTILKGAYDVKVRQEVPIESDHYIPPCKETPLPTLRSKTNRNSCRCRCKLQATERSRLQQVGQVDHGAGRTDHQDGDRPDCYGSRLPPSTRRSTPHNKGSQGSITSAAVSSQQSQPRSTKSPSRGCHVANGITSTHREIHRQQLVSQILHKKAVAGQHT